MSKMISAMLSISLLASGCYSNVPVTKEGPVPENQNVYFYLSDGSYVDSADGSYKRIDGGYQISGWRWKDGRKVASFVGTITDAEIQKVEVNELDSTWTIVSIVVVVAALTYLIAHSLSQPFDTVTIKSH